MQLSFFPPFRDLGTSPRSYVKTVLAWGQRSNPGKVRTVGARLDLINHFVPRELGGDTKLFPVYAGGRSFAHYESVKHRRKWHGAANH